MKKLNIIGALAAGAFAVVTAVIGDINQQRAIDEAIDKRMTSKNPDEEDDEEES